MPLKLKYNAELKKLVEVPGVWVDDADISDEVRRKFREQYSAEDELDVLRSAVIAIAKERLPNEYLSALDSCEVFREKKTAEAETQAILRDRTKWVAAGMEKVTAALTSSGLAITTPVKTIDELKKFAEEKITNFDEVAIESRVSSPGIGDK